MGSTTAEAFIRRHVRRILTEEKDERSEEQLAKDAKKAKEKSSKETKSQGRGQVWSGLKGGRLPKWAIEALGGSKKAERLAETNPAQLMKNLKLSPASGNTTVERVYDLVRTAKSSRPEMGEALGTHGKIGDNDGKSGVTISDGELSGRTAGVIIHDLIIGAAKAGYLELTGNLRIERGGTGTVIFNVSKKSDRWSG